MKAASVLVLSAILAIGSAGAAQAESKNSIFGWSGQHFRELDFKPYLEDQPTWTHDSQWGSENWDPKSWLAAYDSSDEAIGALYFADIIRGQDTHRGTPVLEVGPNFYRLSDRDKQHVTKVIDYVYGITDSRADGVFRLYDPESDREIGLYSKYGLQLK